MAIIRYVPLFLPVLGVYALCMPFHDFHQPGVAFSFVLPSTDTIQVSFNEIFLMGVTVVLFFEIVKAAAAKPGTNWIEHMISTFVFIGFLIMFLVMPGAGTSTFLIVTLMSLIDAMAGWIIALRAALRDVGLGMVGVQADHH